MQNPNPGCGFECRFRYGPESTTCVYYAPVYDKHGNNVNPDRNIRSGEVVCLTCRQAWSYEASYDGTVFTDVRS